MVAKFEMVSTPIYNPNTGEQIGSELQEQITDSRKQFFSGYEYMRLGSRGVTINPGVEYKNGHRSTGGFYDRSIPIGPPSNYPVNTDPYQIRNSIGVLRFKVSVFIKIKPHM